MAGKTACLLVLLLAAGAAVPGAQLDFQATKALLSNPPAVQYAKPRKAYAKAASQPLLAAALDQAGSPQAQAAVPSTETAANPTLDYSLCSAQPLGTAEQQDYCDTPAAPGAVHILAPVAEAADTGDRSAETAELLELAGVTYDATQQRTSIGSAISSLDWTGSSISSQLRKLLGTHSISTITPAGSLHRKLLIYYGPQATHGFLLSYTLSFQLQPSSSLLSNAANDFKLAVETAVGRLIPAPGPTVLPPVVGSTKLGNPLTMTLGIYLQTDAAMKAAAAGTGTSPDELLAAVDAAMTGVTAFKMALDDAALTSRYGLAGISVQPASFNENEANIAACAAFVAKGRRSIGVGSLSGAAYAALVVIPVSVGLAVGLRLLLKIRARRRAAAATAVANPTSAPAINIGLMKVGAAAPAVPQPAVGVLYHGSFSSAGHRVPSPTSIVSPFAACQPGFVYTHPNAAPAVRSAVASGQCVQYGVGYPVVQSPYGVKAAKPAY